MRYSKAICDKCGGCQGGPVLMGGFHIRVMPDMVYSLCDKCSTHVPVCVGCYGPNLTAKRGYTCSKCIRDKQIDICIT